MAVREETEGRRQEAAEQRQRLDVSLVNQFPLQFITGRGGYNRNTDLFA